MNNTQQNYMCAKDQLYNDWDAELKKAKTEAEKEAINQKYENKLEDVGC